MKTTVIHHSADFDGIFCREIASKFLPDAELIGWDFKDEPLKIPEGEGLIYVLDLPVDRVFGYEYKVVGGQHILESYNGRFKGSPDLHTWLFRSVVWIDHHKSSIESHPADISGYRIDGVAACRLAWQWFAMLKGKHDGDIAIQIGNGMEAVNFSLPDKQDFIERKVSEPWAVRLAGEYDIWDKRDPRSELFQHGLRSRNLDDITWKYLLGEDRVAGEHCVADLLEGGKVLEFARANEYRDVITSQGFDIEFEGLKVLACCSHECDIRSHLFEAGIKPHHDALLGFTYTGKAWRVSMYHAPGKEHHDLSLIAKKFGGGGHRGACGFITNSLPFINK